MSRRPNETVSSLVHSETVHTLKLYHITLFDTRYTITTVVVIVIIFRVPYNVSLSTVD